MVSSSQPSFVTSAVSDTQYSAGWVPSIQDWTWKTMPARISSLPSRRMPVTRLPPTQLGGNPIPTM